MSIGQQSQIEGAEERDLGSFDPEEIVHTAEEVAREYPHGALAGCFALGFVLGGGLTPRLLSSVLLFVGRRYAATAARSALDAALRSSTREENGAPPAPGDVERHTARP
jgi:hypothetical protein